VIRLSLTEELEASVVAGERPTKDEMAEGLPVDATVESGDVEEPKVQALREWS
jgi:hypothetical protein